MCEQQVYACVCGTMQNVYAHKVVFEMYAAHRRQNVRRVLINLCETCAVVFVVVAGDVCGRHMCTHTHTNHCMGWVYFVRVSAPHVCSLRSRVALTRLGQRTECAHTKNSTRPRAPYAQSHRNERK